MDVDSEGSNLAKPEQRVIRRKIRRKKNQTYAKDELLQDDQNPKGMRLISVMMKKMQNWTLNPCINPPDPVARWKQKIT